MDKLFIFLVCVINFSIPAIVYLFKLPYILVYLVCLTICLFILLKRGVRLRLIRKLNIERIFYFSFIFSVIFSFMIYQEFSEKIMFTFSNIFIMYILFELCGDIFKKNIEKLPLILLLSLMPHSLVLLISGLLTANKINLYDNVIYTSRIFGIVTLAAIYLGFKYKKFFYIFMPLAFISIFVVFQSGSRQVLVALGVCLLIYLITILMRKKFVTFGIYIYFFMISVVVIVIFLKDQFSSLYMIQRLMEQGLEGSGRGGIINLIIDEITSNNLFQFIFGIGYGNLSLVVGGNLIKYPHNIFIEILVEIGVLNLILLTLYMIVSYKDIVKMKYKSITEQNEYFFIQILFVYFFLIAMFSSDIPGNSVLFFILLMITNLKYQYKEGC